MYYGWYIAAAGALLMGYNSFLVLYGFTAFVTPLVATFGWSYAQVSAGMSMRSIQMLVLSPLLGMAVDRWPVKKLLLMGVLVFGFGLIWLSRVEGLMMFYAGCVITGFGSALAGQMIPQTTVARWFRRDLGKASGILASSIALGGISIPLLVKVIDAYGWQRTFLFAAIGIWGIGIPLSFIFRNRPEDHGLLPDGKSIDEADGTGKTEVSEYSPDVREALKMPAFWIISVGAGIQVGCILGALVHLMPYLTGLGITRSDAGFVVMLVPLVGLAARMPFGMLMDVFPKKYMLALCIGLTGIGIFSLRLIHVDSAFGMKLLFAVSFGFGASSVWLRPAILREYFGTKRFGAIYGLIAVSDTIGAASAPPVTGWIFDRFSSYTPALISLGAVCMFGALLVLTLPSRSR